MGLLRDRIIKSAKVKWRGIKDLQPDNVKLPYNISAVKSSLLKYGVGKAFDVWQDPSTKDIYFVDGHTRKDILLELIADGHDLPETFTCNFADYKDRNEAVSALIEIHNQRHNPFAGEVLTEWIETEAVEVDIETVNVVFENTEKEKPEENPLGIFPLSIVLNAKEYKDFQLFKKENRYRTDTEAFKNLFDNKLLAE